MQGDAFATSQHFGWSDWRWRYDLSIDIRSFDDIQKHLFPLSRPHAELEGTGWRIDSRDKRVVISNQDRPLGDWPHKDVPITTLELAIGRGSIDGTVGLHNPILGALNWTQTVVLDGLLTIDRTVTIAAGPFRKQVHQAPLHHFKTKLLLPFR